MGKGPEEDLLGHTKYEWLEPLGTGGFGAVGLCRVRGTEEKVAVKFLPIGGANAKPWREVMNHRRLRHSHVIEFKEVFLTEHYICIAMEFANKGNLCNFVRKRGRLQEPVARWFFQQLIMALDYCHQRGVVNRDMKLENTLLHVNLEPDDARSEAKKTVLVKLCDFGYSKADDESLPKSKVGTSNYVAPEVILSASNYDGKMVDIWSCGVMLFSMLFGQFPFYPTEAGPELNALIISTIINKDFAVPTGIPISNECRDLLEKIFVKDPGHRIKMVEIQQHPWFIEGLPGGAFAVNQQYLNSTHCAGVQTHEQIVGVLLCALRKMHAATQGATSSEQTNSSFNAMVHEYMNGVPMQEA